MWRHGIATPPIKTITTANINGRKLHVFFRDCLCIFPCVCLHASVPTTVLCVPVNALQRAIHNILSALHSLHTHRTQTQSYKITWNILPWSLNGNYTMCFLPQPTTPPPSNAIYKSSARICVI